MKMTQTTSELNRRSLIAGFLALVAATTVSRRLEAASSKTRLILLGTGGGPRPTV